MKIKINKLDRDKKKEQIMKKCNSFQKNTLLKISNHRYVIYESVV